MRFWAVFTQFEKTTSGPGLMLRLSQLVRHHPAEIHFGGPSGVLMSFAATISRAIGIRLPNADEGLAAARIDLATVAP